MELMAGYSRETSAGARSRLLTELAERGKASAINSPQYPKCPVLVLVLIIGNKSDEVG